MAVVAKLNYLRIAPRKVRLMADLIRGKSVGQAKALLNFTQKRAALPLAKLLTQAIANAKHNFGLEEENLYISKITVDEGPKLKRWMARARGIASEIQKKTSHVTLVLEEIAKRPKKIKKAKKIEKAEKIKILKREKPPKEGPEGERVPYGAGKPPTRQAKLRPEREVPKPKIEKGIRRIFRRKAF